MSYLNRILTCCFILMALWAVTLNAQVEEEVFSVAEEPKDIGSPLNTVKNDFAPTISPDGSFMIFNSNRVGKYQDLYISYSKDGKWQNPVSLKVLNSPYNDETPFLSSDGKTLIFSSDRDGSKEMPRNSRGQIRVSFDIYWSKFINGKWSSPVSIPGTVNTMHHEKTASLSKDGKTLYYTTWAFGKLSKLQVKKAEFKNGRFSNAKLLPAPFNTGFQDLAIIPAEDLKGFFFSSNRLDSLGRWDLYFVSYVDGKFGKVVNLGKKVNSVGNEIYLARVDQRYFISSTRKGGTGLFDIYSSYIFRKDTSFETRAIHFDYNSHVIKKESFSYLDALSKFLNNNAKVKLEIIGHTDLHGPDSFNLKLSFKRAKSVRDYLILKNLASNRFKIKGEGKTRPVINKTGKGFDEQNRRTEFKIIK